MGRGRSKIGDGGGNGAKNFKIAFNNENMSFSEDRQEWEKFERSFGKEPTRSELNDLSGYIATGNSFRINRKLYTPELGEKALTPSEAKTVSTLDRMVNTHTTPNNSKFVRYVDSDGITALLGMDQRQEGLFLDAVNRIRRGDNDALVQLSKTISGSSAHSASFTSTSAAHKHLFSVRMFKREIDVPKGTKAFATNNASEHEVVFGRNMNTRVTGISFDGKHIVIHETFVKYGERK